MWTNFYRQSTFPSKTQNTLFAQNAPRASLTTRQSRRILKKRKVVFWSFASSNYFLLQTEFLSFLLLNQFCKSYFVKSMFPPLRTKPYYSKPKWRSRRPKSPQMRKIHNSIFLRKSHLLAPKVRFWLFLHFWALFAFLAPNDQKRHQETVTPTSFWAVGPKKWFLSAKMQKKRNCAPNSLFW